MKFLFRILFFKIVILINFSLFTFSYSENHNINEVINKLQNDIKTLEKAVYSNSFESSSQNNSNLTSFNISGNLLLFSSISDLPLDKFIDVSFDEEIFVSACRDPAATDN